ncbi:TRAP transporter small permease [Granulosicoccus antarcticus]|uniref:TRAP transporter small permease protein n=1 Tax=Granulosicoccus antarcticus IMCC3135 TaxID=1192854 RepID=A0A2Z2NWD7_9GAMM|nr:TRAP transporter small permease [Granulosicoccus antarcticus]ASJ72017.1 hypothetical protein IMCC3135_09600 [Granulosicoccus antarcticus IMCC3135]
MRFVLDWYYRILQFALTTMLVLLLVPVSMQILARFSEFVPRYIWTEEVSRFAFIWIIMLGAVVAIRDKSHLVVDVLPKMRPGIEKCLTVLTLTAMFVAGCFFTYGGYHFSRFGALQHSELAGLPMLAIYIAWPFMGVSWLVFTIEQIHDHVTDNKECRHGTV